MLKQFWRIYNVQLLVSITLTIVISALSLIKLPQTYLTVLLAAILGTFTLDLDYIIYAFVLEPTKDFSKHLRAYITHFDLKNALAHIEHNKDEVDDKTLHGVFFQVLLALITVFAVSTTSSIFVKVFILSTYANSIYRLTDYYFDGKIKEWFWALKKTPDKHGVVTYGVALFAVLIYCISIY